MRSRSATLVNMCSILGVLSLFSCVAVTAATCIPLFLWSFCVVLAGLQLQFCVVVSSSLLRVVCGLFACLRHLQFWQKSRGHDTALPVAARIACVLPVVC
jgi:lipid-A-disaccharide synthase-like uncharacterized protein